MSRLVAILLCIIVVLPGCATPGNADKPRDPVIVGQKVEVGVREKCVLDLPDEPKWANKGVTSSDPLVRSEAILRGLEQHEDWWENKVKPALGKCR